MRTIEARARKKIKDSSGQYAERLGSLLHNLEVANDLSHAPVEILASKPLRYRQQVMARVQHWAEKADVAHRQLAKALGEKDCSEEDE